MRHVVAQVAALIAPLLSAAAIGAQQRPGGLGVGSPVRVVADMFGQEAVRGVIVAVTSDSLTIQRRVSWREREGMVDTVSLARNTVRRIDVPNGSHTNGKPGMVLGLVGGALTGWVAGAATYKPCTCARVLGPNNSGDAGANGAAIGALFGVVTGGIIGLFIHSDRWIALEHESASIFRLDPNPHGIAVRMSLSAR